jgi:hypothetical protein
MKNTITGAELKDWYNNHWPTIEGSPIDAFYHDYCDSEFDIDSLADDAVMHLDELGYVQYQGTGRDPRNRKDISVESYIKEWRKSRACDFVLCSVPKEKTEELLQFLKTINATRI